MIGCKGGVVNQFHLGIFPIRCDLSHGCQRSVRVLFATPLDRSWSGVFRRHDAMRALVFSAFEKNSRDEAAIMFVRDWRARSLLVRWTMGDADSLEGPRLCLFQHSPTPITHQIEVLDSRFDGLTRVNR